MLIEEAIGRKRWLLVQLRDGQAATLRIGWAEVGSNGKEQCPRKGCVCSPLTLSLTKGSAGNGAQSACLRVSTYLPVSNC